MADSVSLRELRRGFPTFIHKDTSLLGKAKSHHSVRIQGGLSGSLDCDSRLILDETGRLDGEFRARYISITGTVEGRLEAQEQLELLSTCTVHATIESPKLRIDPGVEFEGECHTFDKADVDLTDRRQKRADS